VFGVSSFHGRLVLIDRDCAKEQTGHGSPMPQMVHGGPGRAGGGEELGGVRSVHPCQRTALQVARMLTGVTGSWTRMHPSSKKTGTPSGFISKTSTWGKPSIRRNAPLRWKISSISRISPATRSTLTWTRKLTKGHPFFPGRVAHGYLLLSFAAGLFVDPDPGPVLANYGLDSLRFIKPIQPGRPSRSGSPRKISRRVTSNMAKCAGMSKS
jgi:oxepin-CoA hydrolase/3-oxo-5,6-dehydrosuberyl-CoA semialdehyde dehydrogenase